MTEFDPTGGYASPQTDDMEEVLAHESFAYEPESPEYTRALTEVSAQAIDVLNRAPHVTLTHNGFGGEVVLGSESGYRVALIRNAEPFPRLDHLAFVPHDQIFLTEDITVALVNEQNNAHDKVSTDVEVEPSAAHLQRMVREDARAVNNAPPGTAVEVVPMRNMPSDVLRSSPVTRVGWNCIEQEADGHLGTDHGFLYVTHIPLDAPDVQSHGVTDAKIWEVQFGEPVPLEALKAWQSRLAAYLDETNG